MTKYREIRLVTRVATISVLLLLGICDTSVFAHEKSHSSETKQSSHMQAMQEVKNDIPEDYRLMERTPLVPDPKSLEIGEEFFLQNCSVCHGKKGDGKGPAAAGLATPPANFLDSEHSGIYGPGEKFWIIGRGIEASGMPAFPQLSLRQRWLLVNYILSLQQKN